MGEMERGGRTTLSPLPPASPGLGVLVPEPHFWQETEKRNFSLFLTRSDIVLTTPTDMIIPDLARTPTAPPETLHCTTLHYTRTHALL